MFRESAQNVKLEGYCKKRSKNNLKGKYLKLNGNCLVISKSKYDENGSMENIVQSVQDWKMDKNYINLLKSKKEKFVFGLQLIVKEAKLYLLFDDIQEKQKWLYYLRVVSDPNSSEAQDFHRKARMVKLWTIEFIDYFE